MNRTQKKWVKKINSSVSPDRPTVEFAVVGKTKQALTQNAKIALGIFAAIAVVALIAGVVLLPGALFFVWLFRETKPPRLVTVSRNEICSYTQGFFNNGPGQLVAAIPLVPLQASESQAQVMIGFESITFKAKEYRLLVEATHQLLPSAVQTPTQAPTAPRVPAMAAPVPQIFS